MKSNILMKVFLMFVLVFYATFADAQRHKHHHQRKQDPHFRYEKLPHWGRIYKHAPKQAFVVPHSGIRYHYRSGIFYKPHGQNYVIVRAPIGVRVRNLPVGYVRFINSGRTYYYYYGTYYEQSADDNEYITVSPPVGARVDALPDGYQKVIIDEKAYYEFEGTYYKAIVDTDGEIWYEVVGEK